MRWRGPNRRVARFDDVVPNGVLLFTRDTGSAEHDLRARMYAPGHGIGEDPATGSAAAALAGLLAVTEGDADGWMSWRIGQGIEMGRPSLLRGAREAGGRQGGRDSRRRCRGGRRRGPDRSALKIEVP